MMPTTQILPPDPSSPTPTLTPNFHNMTDRPDRIIGVDIAKIVAMILVVAVHVNGFGLPYVGDNPPGLGYMLMRSLLGAIFMACINIFALASGYVGITSSFNLSRIIRLWIQVVFTGLMVLACIDFFTGINIQSIDYLKACAPVAKGQYWYVTAYFMLCFVMPILNAGIKAMDKRSLGGLLLLLLGMICGEHFMLCVDALGVNAGYSFEWLLVMYMVGAYMRLYNPLDKGKWSLLWCTCLCAMIVGWGPPVLNKAILLVGSPITRPLGFGGYTSPFIAIIALCIFTLCLKIRVSSERAKKIITLLSSTTLGVYLIHVQPVFFKNVFISSVRKLAVSGGGGYLCSLILATVAIYIVCSILDFLRIILFKSVERVVHKFPCCKDS